LQEATLLSSPAPRPGCPGAAAIAALSPIGPGVRRSLNQTLDSGAMVHQGGSCAPCTGPLRTSATADLNTQRVSMSGSPRPFARRSLGVLSRIAPGRRGHTDSDQLGGIEGPVVRRFEGGFTFPIEATHHKRETLADRLVWLARRAAIADWVARRCGPIAPGTTVSQLALAQGVRAGVQRSRPSDRGRLHRNPEPAGVGYRGVARPIPAAPDAPSRAKRRRAMHRQPSQLRRWFGCRNE
jgi:hypothetical protein